MENAQELIGILQAISIVAKSLAAKLMQIEQQIRDYEAAGQEERCGKENKEMTERKKVFICSPFRGIWRAM